MNPPPWPNSKTQVPFEAKGLVKFPELGSADPFRPCPLLSRWQGYSHSGPPWEGSALGDRADVAPRRGDSENSHLRPGLIT